MTVFTKNVLLHFFGSVAANTFTCEGYCIITVCRCLQLSF